MPHETPPTVLTIAGSDPSGGAGIQADLKTFAAEGTYGICAVTAITAQNSRGVSAIDPVSASMVLSQLRALTEDFQIQAIKTGMLAKADIVEAVCDTLETCPTIPVVVDPVISATTGDRLLDVDALELVRRRLLSQARVVTPNRIEAEVLAEMHISSRADAVHATSRIRALCARAVVLTGGHFDGPQVVDLLDDDGHLIELTGPRIDCRHTHGTGCTFAAAIAAGLAHQRPLAEAVAEAKHFVEGAIRDAAPLLLDRGPVNHSWRNERQ